MQHTDLLQWHTRCFHIRQTLLHHMSNWYDQLRFRRLGVALTRLNERIVIPLLIFLFQEWETIEPDDFICHTPTTDLVAHGLGH